jgi:hypothetical protein
MSVIEAAVAALLKQAIRLRQEAEMQSTEEYTRSGRRIIVRSSEAAFKIDRAEDIEHIANDLLKEFGNGGRPSDSDPTAGLERRGDGGVHEGLASGDANSEDVPKVQSNAELNSGKGE